MSELVEMGYINLFEYLISKYFKRVNIGSIIELDSKYTSSAIQTALYTKKAYLIHNGVRITTIRNCIFDKNIKGMMYMLRVLMITPTDHERELIAIAFPALDHILFLMDLYLF